MRLTLKCQDFDFGASLIRTRMSINNLLSQPNITMILAPFRRLDRAGAPFRSAVRKHPDGAPKAYNGNGDAILKRDCQANLARDRRKRFRAFSSAAGDSVSHNECEAQVARPNDRKTRRKRFRFLWRTSSHRPPLQSGG